MTPRSLQEGDVVQLSPATVKNPMFAACTMVVTEPKPWGAQGYVQSLGEGGAPGGEAYYRATWEEMEYVGRIAWMRQPELDEEPRPGLAHERNGKPLSEWTAAEWKRLRGNQPSRTLLGEEHYLLMLRDYEAIRSRRRNFRGKPDSLDSVLIDLDRQFERFYKLFLD